VAERIHDDEPDTTETTVRALLAAQCPEWADHPLTYLETSGTDNAMWRVHMPDGADVVIRLPRQADAAENVDREVDVLRSIAPGRLTAVVNTPEVRFVGEPSAEFPYRWFALGWLDGVDMWTARASMIGAPLEDLAIALAEAIRTIGELTDVVAPHRAAGGRGGPIKPLLERLDRWLDDPQWCAHELIDVAAVRRCADQTQEVAGEPATIGFVHGDLIPGNLLVTAHQLSAIIDWGTAAYADLAQDLAPAWAVFEGRSRQVFQEAIGADDATWLRARAFELEHAVGAVLYYVPRHHPLGDVMIRTLHRILVA
jgi:aminoglycoside phosphotransferase (APT) family kinase protein